ncbi:hypothetical protein FA15DRAFT_673708 [Coprinopsis marcescibilis]|uniref:Uncharacterized protein n=1 Tax=Coprinopsis marcescibilis TaxID=230819 RepID=A0A5C3KJA2_COPMA|nr:hypothetical protein FA15DRAFT_673708 [Coprinopsis marcescibilis]
MVRVLLLLLRQLLLLLPIVYILLPSWSFIAAPDARSSSSSPLDRTDRNFGPSSRFVSFRIHSQPALPSFPPLPHHIRPFQPHIRFEPPTDLSLSYL